jgi:serine-type D-Ala-D-Ala carboxypeptidase (penicillin-binding protein 5/6)
VAGESPGKSEQRKPSGETAASARGVPRDPRDPRIGASGESAPPAGTREEPGRTSETVANANKAKIPGGAIAGEARQGAAAAPESGTADGTSANDTSSANAAAGSVPPSRRAGDVPRPASDADGRAEAAVARRAPDGAEATPVVRGAAKRADREPSDGTPPAPGTPDAATPDDKAPAPTTGGKAPAPTTGGKAPRPAPIGDKGAAARSSSTFVPLKRDDMPVAPGRPPLGPPVSVDRVPAGAAQASSLTESERTKQLPVPPKPPLDLLAELTNTPDTPVGVVVRRLKIWTPLVALLAIVYVVVQGVRPLPTPVLRLTAGPTVTIDGAEPTLPWPDEGQGSVAAAGTGQGSMGTFGKQTPVPIGSVAKAMTAYIVLKDNPLKPGAAGPSITVDKAAEQQGKLDSEGESTLDTVKEGDKLTLKEALSAIMIPSANNIARLLARWDAGSEAAFVKKMNAEAKALGMDHTTYTDPSGLTPSTVSTANDLVKLGLQLVRIPALMAITEQPVWTDPSGKKWTNYNRLVPFNGAIGIKTGTTTKAGGNELFAAEKVVGGKNQLIVGAILGQYKPPIIDTVNAASKVVMIKAESVLKAQTVVRKGEVVGYVDDGLGTRTPVVAAADAVAVGWGGKPVRMQLAVSGKQIPHAAAVGTRVGTLTVDAGATPVQVPVNLEKATASPGFGAKLGSL